MANLQNNHDHHQVVVVMVPFPAQGHLNQLLQLSRLISSYHIPVHYLGSATHIRQAKARVQGWGHISSVEKMHFHDFKLAPFVSPPPNPNNVLTKFPSHMIPSFEASSSLRIPVSAFLRSLSSKARRVIVIFDTLMVSVVQEVCSISNAEAYNFHSVSAFVTCCHEWESKGKPIDFGIPIDIPSLDGCFSPEFFKFIIDQYECTKLKTSGNLYNTNKLIEPSYLDLLAKEETGGPNKHWAIGPFNPMSLIKDEKNHGRHMCLEWLDKQEKNSVIYISFGSTTTLSDDEIKELAIGLEQSKQKFIWVLRDADKGDVFENAGENEVRRDHLQLLPKGYEERTKETGFLVTDWAPQLEILGHESTGGFMSHCGWNSCTESLSMGVPIAAWPMHSDQPRNAVLITKVLKLGVQVKDWTRRDEVVTSVKIKEAVKRLMASGEGDDIRKRAAELGEAVRHSMDQGGVSRSELDSFISHVTR